ncbi:MAG TPA: malate synthase A [Nevskiales bacterium]|nr:malate synthase A [Nevskiales bacterium]
MTPTAVNRGGAEILGPIKPEYDAILTHEALAFVVQLVRKHRPRLKELLAARQKRAKEIDAGKLPDFLPETQSVREGNWKIAGIPADLQDRRVEITGPVDRKMIINALNAPVKCFMADFEDSQSPTWHGLVEGQINLRDAVDGSISFTSPEGKQYRLKDKIATLIVRPRGWHLPEKHVKLDGEVIPGALFDFGLFFFHNAKKLLAKGTGPYFYLPKMESHLEARLWNDVFNDAQDALGIARGTIKATVLIETILAVFEMDEILYELRDHIVGLNCGRWDYIFSFIKKFRNHPDKIMPDRHSVGMDRHFLSSYSQLLIKTCHRRGAMAMGGMAAFIPVKDNAEANEKAFAKVRADKEREAKNGHDGTWIAHPGLAQVATEVFDRFMPGPNQLNVLREDVHVTAKDLLDVPKGDITEGGLRNNISVGVQYIEAWISGNGCVPLYNLMEDAATAEISRTQVWQWIKHPTGVLTDGRKVTVELFRQILDEEMDNIRREVGDERFAKGRFTEAKAIMDRLCTDPECADFLTLPAYDYLP